jgi:flagellar hook assembly protein FlgD
LVIYNLLGQRVKSLVQGQQSAGQYSVHWDGTSDAGLPVSSGIYIYRITVDNFVQSRKMMLLK